jgi:RNA-directed DNA polymerase
VGTPQGAVVSPLLANVYLHYVFDLWVEVWRKKVARGNVIVVRYADDLVLGFQHRADAERFLSEFRDRLVRFGLELHPDKTRLIEFGRFAVRNRKQRGEGKPETFTFLGFTHFCGNLTSSGAFNVWRLTAKERMVAKLNVIKAELQHRKRSSYEGRRHMAPEGCAGLLPIPCCARKHRSVARLQASRMPTMRSVLVRRSQRAQVGWDRLNPLLNRWIPHPHVLHPYPDKRFDAIHPR